MVRMDLFRSEEMNKVQLIIPSDSAHYTMTYLAEIGQLQFKDVSVFFDLCLPLQYLFARYCCLFTSVSLIP
jgi:hypothetical protein